ncbi:low molecular weight protein-tyrosine-phosphatase [Corynebacterium sp. Marseille-Q2516]
MGHTSPSPASPASPASAASPDDRLHLTVVCTGNICRSPMGEALLNTAITAAGLDAEVRVTSCGMGGWHVGQPAAHRARAELPRHGIDASALRASQFGPDDAAADLLLAMDHGHQRQLRHAGVDPERIALFRSFDPHAPAHAEVADPYYDGPEEFARTYQQLHDAIPGILDWIQAQLAGRRR